MLLTISTTHYPASDLSFLLHKHPAKIQQIELSAGHANIYYPEVSDARCTIALLLEIDPVGLVRQEGPSGNDFALEQYVNDRPYVASSFMSAAIAKGFSTALNGRCKEKPELVTVAMPFEVTIAVLPVCGGEPLLRQLFEPLGYEIEVERHPVDSSFPEWGDSRYFTVTLRNTLTLQNLLSHLYILIPVCDNDKHYWVGQHEVEKLTEKSRSWLPLHPVRDLIISRYLKHQRSLSTQALRMLMRDEEEADDESFIPQPKVHDLRLQAVRDELIATGAKRIADLGCGEGKLLKLLLQEKQVEFILGMDVSYRSLEIAKERLKFDRLPEHQQKKLQLIQSSLTYYDKRIGAVDAAALVEVIEHLDEPRLSALRRIVFGLAKPVNVIITTPNAEYNIKFPDFQEGTMRHSDHRFEWTRTEFENWANHIAEEFGYTVRFKPVGMEDPEVGALTQMAIFTQSNHAIS